MSLIKSLGLEDSTTYLGAAVPTSDDEALVLENDARDLRYEIDQDLRTVSRAEAAAIGMEDMAEIIEVMGDGDEVMPDVRAIATVAAQQVDGDVAPQDVIGTLAFELDDTRSIKAELDPSEISGTALESYHGFKGVKRVIAVESLKEKALKIWQTIRDFVKKIFKKVKDFFYKYLGAIPRKRKAIEALKEEVKKVSDGGKRPEGKLEITSGISRLVVGDSPVKSGKDFVTAMNNLNKEVGDLSRGGAINLNNMFEGVVDVMNDLDLENPDTTIEQVGTFVSAYHEDIDGRKKKPTYDRESSDSKSAHVLAELIGDKRIIGYAPKASNPFTGPAVKANAQVISASMSWARDHTVRLVSSDKKLPDSVDFTVMTSSDMMDVLNACLKILESVEGFQRGKLQEKREKLITRMEKASDKLSKEYDRLSGQGKQDDEDGHKASITLVRGLLNFNQFLVGEYAHPATEMCAHAGSQVDFAIAFVRKNMAQYKTRD